MICVTFNMGRSAANCQGNVMEFHVVLRVVSLKLDLEASLSTTLGGVVFLVSLVL